jgi:hypothetical protein
MGARASRPAELPELARRLRVAADHLVDIVDVDLAGAVPGNRPLDLLDELRKLVWGKETRFSCRVEAVFGPLCCAARVKSLAAAPGGT